MNISEGRILFNSPTTQVDISVEDFSIMLEMYERIVNKHTYAAFLPSDNKVDWVVGNLKDQIKEDKK